MMKQAINGKLEGNIDDVWNTILEELRNDKPRDWIDVNKCTYYTTLESCLRYAARVRVEAEARLDEVNS